MRLAAVPRERPVCAPSIQDMSVRVVLLNTETLSGGHLYSIDDERLFGLPYLHCCLCNFAVFSRIKQDALSVSFSM